MGCSSSLDSLLDSDAEPAANRTADPAWLTEISATLQSCERQIKENSFLEEVNEVLDTHWDTIHAAIEDYPYDTNYHISLGDSVYPTLALSRDSVSLSSSATRFALEYSDGVTTAYFAGRQGDTFTVEESVRDGVREYYQCIMNTEIVTFEFSLDYEGLPKPVVPDTTRQITLGKSIWPTLVEAKLSDGSILVQRCTAKADNPEVTICKSKTVDVSLMDQVIPPVAVRKSMFDFRSWELPRIDEARLMMRSAPGPRAGLAR